VISILCSALEALGWQAIYKICDVRFAVTSWPEALNNDFSTPAYNPWCHGGKNA